MGDFLECRVHSSIDFLMERLDFLSNCSIFTPVSAVFCLVGFFVSFFSQETFDNLLMFYFPSTKVCYFVCIRTPLKSEKVKIIFLVSCFLLFILEMFFLFYCPHVFVS